VIQEAPIEQVGHGLEPAGPGWFVLNAREARWRKDDVFGAYTRFEGSDDAKFSQVGINIGVLQPGQPACLYHREDNQEDFLVLSGECVLLIEGEERSLNAWDFVHCPAWAEHVIVGAGTGPCAILAVGARVSKDVVYPVSELAQRYGAGVDVERRRGADGRAGENPYAGFPPDDDAEFDDSWLPA